MPKKLDQDTKDHVIRLIEDHTLTERRSCYRLHVKPWRRSLECLDALYASGSSRLGAVAAFNTRKQISSRKTPSHDGKLRISGH